MDGESFTACASTGKTYTGLGEGPHTFQVRATDPSLNTDVSPASYSFSVVLPVTQPEVIRPGGPAAAGRPEYDDHPQNRRRRPRIGTPTFKFKSSVAGAQPTSARSTGKALKPCRSPLTHETPLPFARHTLKVAAIAGGNKDGTPAVASFKVVKPR